MSQQSEFDPVSQPLYSRPPVVETLLAVQFKPLSNFKSLHYGFFWASYLGEMGWIPVADEPPLPRVAEAFDNPQLKSNQQRDDDDAAVGVRVRLKNEAGDRVLQFQPDKLLLSWVQVDPASGDRPHFAQIKKEFGDLFRAFTDFADGHEIGAIQPDLWEVKYLNQIPPGPLWTEPADWHRVLPKLFIPPPAEDNGLGFATFDGEWYYEIKPRMGRVKVRAAKMLVNQKPPAVLYLRVQARGEIGETGVPDWSSGFDLGHGACNHLFNTLTSPEAQKVWGRSHDN